MWEIFFTAFFFQKSSFLQLTIRIYGYAVSDLDLKRLLHLKQENVSAKTVQLKMVAKSVMHYHIPVVTFLLAEFVFNIP